MIILTSWHQVNVLVDQNGHTRLTEYGLAPINSDPQFAVPAIPGAVGISRWSAPEIIEPSCDSNGILVMESKPTDVFSFAMFAVEVFAGTVPFKRQTLTIAALCIIRGERLEMPGNAPDVGLTDEMWGHLKSCWQQDPKKRSTMEEVVKEWRKFVEHNGDGNFGIATECM